MSIEKLSTLIEISISVLGIWFVWFVLWKKYALERLEFDIRVVRGNLEKLIENDSSGINSTDKVYIALIEYFDAHVDSLPRLSFAFFLIRYALDRISGLEMSKPKKLKRLEYLIKQIPNKDTEAVINGIKDSFDEAFTRYIVKKSFCLLSITLAVSVFLIIQYSLKNMFSHNGNSDHHHNQKAAKVAYSNSLNRVEHFTGFRVAM